MDVEERARVITLSTVQCGREKATGEQWDIEYLLLRSTATTVLGAWNNLNDLAWRLAKMSHILIVQDLMRSP